MKIKKHKAGRILLTIAIIVSLMIYALLIYFCNLGIKNIVFKEQVFEFLNEDGWIIDIMKQYGGYAAIIILIMVLVKIFMAFYDYGITALAYDVPVTENQFKELLDFEVECANKLGLKEVPKIYIDTYSYGEEEKIDISGVKFDNKHILRIDAQDIYNCAEEGYYIAKFTIAKKLTAIYFGYLDVHIMILTLCSKWIPIFSQLRNRIVCYDCDKGAVALLGVDLTIKAIVAKATGFYLTPYLNYDDYILNMKNVVDEKDVIFENILLDVPLAAYRIEAILQDKEGRLF